jgi:hypothetical protein
MGDVRCMPGHHLGDEEEGRCSFCGDRIEQPSVLVTALVFVAVVIAVVTAIQALIYWLTAM